MQSEEVKYQVYKVGAFSWGCRAYWESKWFQLVGFSSNFVQCPPWYNTFLEGGPSFRECPLLKSSGVVQKLRSALNAV